MERAKYKGKSVDGIVISVEERTAGDHRIATLRIRDSNDKIWQCQFWNDDANAIVAQDMTGRRLYVEGGLKADNEVSVKYFNADFLSKPRGVEAPDPEGFADWLRKNNRVMVKNIRDGKVLNYSHHKRDCIKVNGEWESKMEYCSRVVGDDEIMKHLKDFRGKLSFDVNKYKEKMELLLDYCARLNSDDIERYDDNEDR